MGATYGAGFLSSVSVPEGEEIEALKELGVALGAWAKAGGGTIEFGVHERVGQHLVRVDVVPGHGPTIEPDADIAPSLVSRAMAEWPRLTGGMPWTTLSQIGSFDEVNMLVPTFGVRTGPLKVRGQTFWAASADGFYFPDDTDAARDVAKLARRCDALGALFVIR